MITMWYLQSQRTWGTLCNSCRRSSFLPRGAFPEGRAYAVSRRLHAGSLEALRVARPEAVELASIKSGRRASAFWLDVESLPARAHGRAAGPIQPCVLKAELASF